MSATLQAFCQAARSRDAYRSCREIVGSLGQHPIDVSGREAIVATHLHAAVRQLGRDVARGADGAACSRILADAFRRVDPTAVNAVARIEEKFNVLDEWAFWERLGPSPLHCRAIRALARVVAGAEMARASGNGRASVPALTEAVIDPLARTYWTGPLVRTGGGLTGRAGSTIPARLAAVDDVASGLALAGGVAAHRLLRWQVGEAHRKWQQGQPECNTLEVIGGLRELAAQLGVNGHGAAEDVRQLLRLEASLILEIRGRAPAEASLIAYTVYRAAPGRPERLVITLGDLLVPGFVHKLDRDDPIARRLVPLPELAPFVGRPNEHGAQAAFQIEVIRALRSRAPELAEHGVAHLPPPAIDRCGSAANLPPRLVPQVLDRWLRDGDDGPAFLLKDGRDRYSLAPAHADAQAFLVDAGRASREARQRALRAKLGKK